MQHGKGGYKDEKDENLMPQWWENDVQGLERAKLIPPERFEPSDSNSVDRLLGIDFVSVSCAKKFSFNIIFNTF